MPLSSQCLDLQQEAEHSRSRMVLLDLGYPIWGILWSFPIIHMENGERSQKLECENQAQSKCEIVKWVLRFFFFVLISYQDIQSSKGCHSFTSPLQKAQGKPLPSLCSTVQIDYPIYIILPWTRKQCEVPRWRSSFQRGQASCKAHPNTARIIINWQITC